MLKGILYMVDDIIRNRITALRKSKGLTQAELGAQIGVSAKTVSKWETGRSYPDILLLPRLAAALGVTVDALFSETDAEPEQPFADHEPLENSPSPKTPRHYLASIAFGVSVLSVLLLNLLTYTTYNFLYGSCCAIFLGVVAGTFLLHFFASCRENGKTICPPVQKWLAVAAVAFSVHAAVLGIAYLAASYRSGFVATVSIVDDPKYGIISSGAAAVAALWAWRKRW